MAWRTDVVHKYFMEHDAEQILQLKLPRSKAEDFIAWLHEKSGAYSVKSAYKLARDLQSEEDGTRQMSSSNQNGSPVWKSFWKIPLPHKVLIFGWKVANNGLATQDNKKRRGIEVTSMCKICGVEEESCMHALIRCNHAKTLRDEMRVVWMLPDENFFLSLTPENLVVSVDNQDVDTGAKILLLLWRTWQVRNNITHETEKLSFAKSVGFLTKHWTELCSIRQDHRLDDTKGKTIISDSLVAGRRERETTRVTQWEKPGDGWCKVNVDGAFEISTRVGGIGVVIRDQTGSVILSAWKYLAHGSDAEEVEALACREGMQLAAEWCPSKVILESDCNYVVGLLRHGNFQRSRLKFLLEETREAGNMLPEWTTVHVRRERNRAAHELAQLAKRTTHSAVWRFTAPICVEQIIAQECNFISE